MAGRLIGLRMRISIVHGSLVAAFVGASVLATCPNPSTGPDIFCADLTGVNNFGQVGDIRAYGVGTNPCNLGNAPLLWTFNTNQHPIYTQNLFRLMTVNGTARIEHIGQSWAWNEFNALNQGLFCSCSAPPPPNSTLLYTGCNSVTAAPQAGNQSNMGPRSEVNAHTGAFTYPPGGAPAAPTIGRRLQVHVADLDPALNPGAMYFLEGEYVAPDDAVAGNNNNNATYRQALVGASPYNITVTSTAQQQKAAVRAWKDQDASVTETFIQVPNDGLFILAAKATFLGSGTWHYEYALQNMNSDRSGQSFSVPLPTGAIVNNIGFHDVDYHSGEPYALTDWSSVFASNSVTWSSETFAQNVNANALRWGTLYNFRFDANVTPAAQPGNITLGLFKAGTPASVNALTVVPQICAADVNHDGVVNSGDLLTVINSWGPCPAPPTPCPADTSPTGGDGIVNSGDLLSVINHWGPCS